MSSGPLGEAESLAGRRVTVMGLGLFGGGAGAARWALRQGARVPADDLDGGAEVLEDLEVRQRMAILRDIPGPARLAVLHGAAAPSHQCREVRQLIPDGPGGRDGLRLAVRLDEALAGPTEPEAEALKEPDDALDTVGRVTRSGK